MSSIYELNKVIGLSNNVLIIQADNPDADSLASSLALESILEDMGKHTQMFCSVDMPGYLKYLNGWDRVNNEIIEDFDISIIVDTSAASLLTGIDKLPQKSQIISKPTIVLDHHADVECDIACANIVINDKEVVSTGELIYSIAKKLNWNISVETGEFIMTSILADSMGLTTSNTTPKTYIVMSELLKLGVNRTKLEDTRREFNKMPVSIFRYKAELMTRTELIEEYLALLVIPQQEINDYSPLYNPGPLIQPEHLQTEGVKISLVLKSYDSGRVTGTIRCNYGTPIAAKLAKKFGGGGHEYAAGFKLEGAKVDEVKNDCIRVVRELTTEVDA